MNLKQILREELKKELKPMKLMTETYVSENLKYHFKFFLWIQIQI